MWCEKMSRTHFASWYVLTWKSHGCWKAVELWKLRDLEDCPHGVRTGLHRMAKTAKRPGMFRTFRWVVLQCMEVEICEPYVIVVRERQEALVVFSGVWGRHRKSRQPPDSPVLLTLSHLRQATRRLRLKTRHHMINNGLDPGAVMRGHVRCLGPYLRERPKPKNVIWPCMPALR